jgi:hypothetical protein
MEMCKWVFGGNYDAATFIGLTRSGERRILWVPLRSSAVLLQISDLYSHHKRGKMGDTEMSYFVELYYRKLIK